MPNWFAAIPAGLPPATLDDLRRGAPDGLKWFAPEDVHLTVAFLGAFREDRLDAVKAAVAALPSPDIEITPGALRPLPDERRVSALAFELRRGAAEAAAYLRSHHATLCEAAGVAPDPRDPLPHLTIARPPRNSPRWFLRRVFVWAGGVEPPDLTLRLDRLALYESAGGAPGRRFRILFESTPRGAG